MPWRAVPGTRARQRRFRLLAGVELTIDPCDDLIRVWATFFDEGIALVEMVFPVAITATPSSWFNCQVLFGSIQGINCLPVSKKHTHPGQFLATAEPHARQKPVPFAKLMVERGQNMQCGKCHQQFGKHAMSETRAEYGETFG